MDAPVVTSTTATLAARPWTICTGSATSWWDTATTATSSHAPTAASAANRATWPPTPEEGRIRPGAEPRRRGLEEVGPPRPDQQHEPGEAQDDEIDETPPSASAGP